MLLAHSSGLPAYARLFETAKTPTDLLRAALIMPLESAPMERQSTPISDYILLGKALEVIAENRWMTSAGGRYLTPLGLSNTISGPARQVGSDPTHRD